MTNAGSSKWYRLLASARPAAALSTVCLLLPGGLAYPHTEYNSDAVAAADDPKPAPKPRPTREQMEQDARNLRAAEPDIRTRETRIREELEALPESALPRDHWAREWAGDYYVGDGTGMNVRILVAPTAGTTYTWHGCLGLYDGNHGAIAGTFDLDGDGRADGLTLQWELRSQSGYDFDSDNFYFVKWDGADGGTGRRYLVPESKMLDMVNHYNQGGFARDGMYSAPLKYDRPAGQRGSRPARVPVAGVPQLPARWARLLILKPVDATVTTVSPITTGNVTNGVDVTRARVTLDKGSADGLYLGMQVWVNPTSVNAATLTIDTLEEHAAGCEFRAFTSAGQLATPPRAGDIIRMGQDAPEAEE